MGELIGGGLASMRRGVLRAWVHGRASRAGFDPRELGRFDRFLEIRHGAAERPDAPPLQRPRELYPDLRARPWHDLAQLPAARAIETAFPTVKSEFSALREPGALTLHQLPLATAGNWTTYYLRCLGHRVSAHCEQCPATSRLIESLPEVRDAGLVYFSALAPHTHLSAHCGPTNTHLRCHLGIDVPDNCRMRVADETREWREGRCIVFDDSFEHEVWIDSDRERVVLIVDLWHPELSPVERWALAEIRRVSWGAWKYRRAVLRASA